MKVFHPASNLLGNISNYLPNSDTYGSPYGSNNNTNRTNSFAASTNYLQIWPTFYYLFTATLSSRLIKAIKIVKPRTTAQPTNGYQPTTKLRVFIPPESLTDQFRWGMSVDIALHQRPRPSFAAKKAVRHMVVGAPDFSPMFNYWQTSFTSPSNTRSIQGPKCAAVCHFCRKIIFILPAMGRLASCTRTPIQLVFKEVRCHYPRRSSNPPRSCQHGPHMGDYLNSSPPEKGRRKMFFKYETRAITHQKPA